MENGFVREADDRIEEMQHWFNQHSFLVAAAACLLLLTVFLLRDGLRPADLLALGALCLGLALAYSLLRPGKGTPASAQELRRQIGQGRPVLLEFQSPY
jgi:hypothetical protein